MAKGGYARLSVELAAVLAVAGAYFYYKPRLGRPSEASASSVGPAAIEAGPPIILVIDVYDLPFVGEADEHLSTIIPKEHDGKARLVDAKEMGALRATLRELAESGQASLQSGGKTPLKPGQPAAVKVSGRAIRAPLGAPAREELSLGIVASWAPSGAVQLDTWFRKERVEGMLTTTAEMPPNGGRSRVIPGDAVVVSQVLEGARYIVVVRVEKPIGR